MKAFFSTLIAILVAAAIIGLAFFVYGAREDADRRQAKISQIVLDGELSHAQSEWDAEMRRNPQFDPNGDKLVARLRQIREASETGRPIPPSPSEPHATTSPSPAPSVPAVEAITLKKPTIIRVQYGTVTLPVGTVETVIRRPGVQCL